MSVLPSEIYLKGQTTCYLSERWVPMLVSELTNVADYTGLLIAFRNRDENYITPMKGSVDGNKVAGNRKYTSDARLLLGANSDGTYNLQDYTGKFISGRANGAFLEVATQVGGWEKWIFINTLKGVCIKNVHFGNYISSVLDIDYSDPFNVAFSMKMKLVSDCVTKETFKLSRISVAKSIDI